MPSFSRVIGISASHRDDANSEILLNACLNEVSNAGIATTCIPLRKLRILPCDGCQGCDTAEKCHIEDDLGPIYPTLFTADVWVIASPEYWWNVSGLCKNFLDRLNAYWLARKKYFWNKKAAIITVGGQPLERMGYAEQYLEVFCTNLHMPIVGKVKASADGKKEVLEQPLVLEASRALGRKIVNELKEKQ